MTEKEETEWLDGISHNGAIIYDAIGLSKELFKGADIDLGNSLAFAVAMLVPPDGIENWIDSLRMFAAGREAMDAGTGRVQ